MIVFKLSGQNRTYTQSSLTNGNSYIKILVRFKFKLVSLMSRPGQECSGLFFLDNFNAQRLLQNKFVRTDQSTNVYP